MKPVEKMHVRPVPGGRVKDPVTMAVMPAEGAWVPRDTFWTRRVRMHDVIDDTAAEVAKASPLEQRHQAAVDSARGATGADAVLTVNEDGRAAVLAKSKHSKKGDDR